ncbi:putative H/ACA ribonucleoprotein complex non-core subunit NAF1 [Seiridium cardinale]|uniref:H/ACA ribonucleoprotein complex non-core subunit NAF1 n=1 Tax=Seiridium cardinale TaxID=138064 RepID=A0ABR2XYH7_9PEZI
MESKSGFYIPGLTTLAQPQNTQATPTSTVSAPAPTEDASAAPSNDPNDGLVKSTAQGTTTAQDTQKANTTATDIAAMDVDQDNTKDAGTSAGNIDNPPSPPSLTQGLEALLGGLDSLPDQTASSTDQTAANGDQNTEMQDAEQGGGQDNPEWEADSSPYESSSDSSSSDDSDDDDDSDNGKGLMNPDEMARILMEAASDDEGEGKAKGSASGGQLRTKNEVPEEVVPKPDVTITPEMKLHQLGEVEHVVENAILIKAYTSGEYQVLDAGSVLCTEDRTVIAALADLIGSVREPRYMARFTNGEEIKTLGIEVGTKIYYANEHATFVFTEPLKGLRGTDASNLNDEEVNDDEMEFSDDEKEMAYKRELKEKRKARQMAKGGGDASRGGRGGQQGVHLVPASLSYDDEDDGPYRPLSRPSNFGQGAPAFTHGAPESHDGNSYRGGRSDHRGRGRARAHDRGGRGSRGNRGNQRGGSGYSQPPRTQGYPQPAQQSQQPQQPFPYPPPPQFGAAQGYPVPPQFFGASGAQAPAPTFPFPSWPQPPQNLPANYVPPPPPQFQQQGQPAQPTNFFNPAMLANLQSQYQGQNQGQNHGGQQPGQWPQHQGGSG